MNKSIKSLKDKSLYENNYDYATNGKGSLPLFEELQVDIQQVSPNLYKNQSWVRQSLASQSKSRQYDSTSQVKNNLLKSASAQYLTTDASTNNKQQITTLSPQSELFYTSNKYNDEKDMQLNKQLLHFYELNTDENQNLQAKIIKSQSHVETLINFKDSDTNQIVKLQLPSAKALSRITSSGFIEKFKSLTLEVKKYVNQSAAFRDLQERNQFFKDEKDSFPNPGTYNIHDNYLKSSPIRSRNPDVGFNSTTQKISLLFSQKNSTYNLQRSTDLLDFDLIDKPQLKNTFKMVPLEKQSGRDDQPLLYDKSVVQKLNQFQIKQDQLAKKALLQSIDTGDQKRVIVVARNMLQKPLIFNPDKAKFKRIYLKKRIVNFKSTMKGFVPEKGKPFQFPKGYEEQNIELLQ
eukprot:403339369